MTSVKTKTWNIMLDRPPRRRQRGPDKHVYRRKITPFHVFCRHCQYRWTDCSLYRCIRLNNRKYAGRIPMIHVLSALCDGYGEIWRKRCETSLRTEDSKMLQYRNISHEERFQELLKSGRWEDRTMLAALFLLTADKNLWLRMQFRITDIVIRFNDVKLTGISETGYCHLCGAKDLYFGSKKLCMNDLSDANIVNTEAFELIITAIAIKRYGTGVLYQTNRETVVGAE